MSPQCVCSASNAINPKIVCNRTGKNVAGSCVVCSECYQSRDCVQRDGQNVAGSCVLCIECHESQIVCNRTGKNAAGWLAFASDAATARKVQFNFPSHFADINDWPRSSCEIFAELRLSLPAMLKSGPFRRRSLKPPRWLGWSLAACIAGLLTVAPFLYYRYVYTYSKRLREVVPGLVYRSGQMTAPGFREAIRRHGIRLVVNLQDDNIDPDLAAGYFTADTIRESKLCKEMGVRYVLIAPDLIDPRLVPAKRPKAIDKFLALMDDPTNYPVLLHCKAGLHRTGCMVAVYRREFNHWTMEEALRELKGHGFGEFVSTKANAYILEYVVTYQPRWLSRGSRQGAAVHTVVHTAAKP
jgi:protein-tyrosine phosphatase